MVNFNDSCAIHYTQLTEGKEFLTWNTHNKFFFFKKQQLAIRIIEK